MLVRRLSLLLLSIVCLGGVIRAGDDAQLLLEADQIEIVDAEQQKQLVLEKCARYNKLTSSADNKVSAATMLRLAVIHHKGLYGLKESKANAFPYWLGLANHPYDPAKQAQACTMLGQYYQEGWKSEYSGAQIEPDQDTAQHYFSVAKEIQASGLISTK